MTIDLKHLLPLKKRSPKISWETIDRLDWQLWALALLLILVLGGGVLSFMFPSAFWQREELGLNTPERIFFGFCSLLTLVLVYLLQKQAKLRQIKRGLVIERKARE